MDLIEKTVLREDYLAWLREGKDRTDTVKVVTGMRRCGKSTLIMQFIDELKASGIPDNRILHIDFDSEDYQDLADYKEVRDVLKKNVSRTERTYVFLDEVQKIEGWEKNIKSLTADYNADVYVTGSNAYLLSSELATYISGRYLEIKMLPLSFKEYLVMNPVSAEKSVDQRFSEYLIYGSLPVIRPDIQSERYMRGLLEGIYNTVLVRDVITRLRLRSTAGIKKISGFLFSNIGNLTNIASIAAAAGMSPTAVKNYVTALEEAYLFYKVSRFDVKGKKMLNTNEKYYAADTGVRNMMLGWSHGLDTGRLIENVVCLELIRRGYQVVVGSYRDREVDLTAFMNGNTEYYQVAQSIMDPSTAERESKVLDGIRDNNLKMILTMDRVRTSPGKGIRHVNVIDWLLNKHESEWHTGSWHL